jgi:uncharacterized protein YndB with AHSA1/START domain
MTIAAERTIVTTRLLGAPQAVVWDAWTDPTKLAQWCGPNGFTNTIKKFEPWVGGRFDLTMHGPDGTDYRNESHFTVVDPMERIAYYHETVPKFLATVTFEPRGNETFLTMRGDFDTVEGHESAVRVFGAVEGSKQTLAKLAAFVEG